MVMLADEDIQTREVLDWRGLHLLHFIGSSCSQKTRIFLALKNLEWESHPVNLPANENYGEWFMGINPRGLVPVLVHDGTVIIESNDILAYLNDLQPQPALIPASLRDETEELLGEEDDLHLDLRALCFRYFFPGAGPRPSEALDSYRNNGTGTVGGEPDPHKALELAFFTDLIEHNGVSDERTRQAATRFMNSYEKLEARLVDSPFLMGEALSVLDIAWYIYTYRMAICGLPLAERFPNLWNWYEQLHARPEFSREVAEPPPLVQARAAMHAQQVAENSTLAQVAGL